MCQLSDSTLNIPKERISLRDIPFLCCHNYQPKSEEQSKSALTLKILLAKMSNERVQHQRGHGSAILPVAGREENI